MFVDKDNKAPKSATSELFWPQLDVAMQQLAVTNPVSRTANPHTVPSRWVYIDREEAYVYEQKAIEFLRTQRWTSVVDAHGQSLPMLVAGDDVIYARGQHAALLRLTPSESDIPFILKSGGSQFEIDAPDTHAYQGVPNCQSLFSPNTTISALRSTNFAFQCAFHLQGAVTLESTSGLSSAPFYFQVVPDLYWNGRNKVFDLFDDNAIKEFPHNALEINELRSDALVACRALIRDAASERPPFTIEADYHAGNELHRAMLKELARQFLLVIDKEESKMVVILGDLDHVDIKLSGVSSKIADFQLRGTISESLANPMPILPSLLSPQKIIVPSLSTNGL